MKHFSLKYTVLALLAATGVSASAQDSIYFSRSNTLHAFPVSGTTITTSEQNVSVVRQSGVEYYPVASIDSMTFAMPRFYTPQAATQPYFNEPFSSSFGSFTVSTPAGQPWVIDYQTAKGSGYVSGNTTAGSSYLISQPIDLVRSTGAELTFDYLLRYVRQGTANQVLITDFYTGDPTTTEWDTLNIALTEGNNWTTFSHASVTLPQRYLGCSHVRIALYYSSSASGSATWEVKNFMLRDTGEQPQPKPGDDTNNTNRNIPSASAPYSWRLEYPRLHNGANDIVVVHQTNSLGITYSLEWDCSKRAQRWTCYQFHNGLPDNNVGRNEDWKEDEQIPAQYRTSRADYSGTGYSRGHMCASSDRQTNKEQNRQTFYYSNMQPQLPAHNSGIWSILENKVKDWGFHGTYRDTLYVVKAGTIDRDEDIMSYTRTHMPVPRYFYMCILAVKNGKYKAIGFWTKHEKADSNRITDYVKSIDEIEQLTGIDFFCNLPDDIENEVERSYNLSDWGL